MQDVTKRYIPEFSLYYYPETWKSAIESIFNHKLIVKDEPQNIKVVTMLFVIDKFT